MIIPKSAESRQHARGLLTLSPAQVLATLDKDVPYLSDGRASLTVDRQDYKNVGGYHCYETVVCFLVDGSQTLEYRITNHPHPASWKTEKGNELRLFIHRVYDRLHDLAMEEEAKDEQTHNEMLLSAHRNAARLVEQCRRFW